MPPYSKLAATDLHGRPDEACDRCFQVPGDVTYPIQACVSPAHNPAFHDGRVIDSSARKRRTRVRRTSGSGDVTSYRALSEDTS